MFDAPYSLVEKPLLEMGLRVEDKTLKCPIGIGHQHSGGGWGWEGCPRTSPKEYFGLALYLVPRDTCRKRTKWVLYWVFCCCCSCFVVVVVVVVLCVCVCFFPQQ